ncbi:MAG: NADH-quinone oxidoreductase subunit A [Desulfurellaceae bacterium]|jgi:NADH-quinone oxidoreductase subunit A|nr:NADH-quinone oxidoreductase subunit A [Desulfurellaceae bacterium]
MQNAEWLLLGIGWLFFLVVFFILIALAYYLAPKEYSKEKLDLYECGVPFVDEAKELNIKFFIIAVLFTLFDVEAIFMYPWAVNFKELGVLGVIELSIFIVFVFIGWIYAWAKGALEWE